MKIDRLYEYRFFVGLLIGILGLLIFGWAIS